jgi:hypothetical protein
MIPKLIHFVWTGPPMPGWAQANVDRFRRMNPDMPVALHGNEVLLPCFQKAYDRVTGEYLYSRRSDVLRVCALLRYGGWYFDCDFLLLRPLIEVYDGYGLHGADCFLTRCAPHHLTQRPVIANGIIGCSRESPMLALVATSILMAAEEEAEIGWDYYGPRIMGRLVSRYPHLATVGHQDLFYPIQDRQQSIRAYRRIMAANYSPQVILEAMDGKRPYAMHMAMQEQLELG